MPKVYHRDAHVRFSLSLSEKDRALLDTMQSRYETQIGSPLSLSIVVSLMLRELATG
jgi:hypothetical protein